MKKFRFLLCVVLLGLLAANLLQVPAQAKDEEEWAPRSAFVRVLHAIPYGYKVDVFVDSTKILNDVVFDSSISKYIRLPAGNHRIRIVSNNPSRTLYDVSSRLRINRFYTLAVVGNALSPKVRLVDETRGSTHSTRARLTVTHFAAGVPPIDIVARTMSGRYSAIVKGLRYGRTREFWITPGKYDLFVRANGRVIKRIDDAEPQAGRRYAAYAIGNPSANGENTFNLILDVSASQ